MPDTRPSNRDLFLPFAVPYAVYVGIASLPSDWLSPQASSALRIVATGAAVAWAWRRYLPLRGPSGVGGSVVLGGIVGLIGTVLWVGLARPFAPGDASALDVDAAVLRIVAATLLVPLFEEQLMRGYVLRFALQWDRARGSERDPLGFALDSRSVNDVRPGDWSWMAIAISTAVFTLGHRPFEWPAAISYGLLMAGLWAYRRDLLGCVVAHAVTNLALGLYVITTGTWGLW
jgi:membrane protease YdiL (CAAX protease family)